MKRVLTAVVLIPLVLLAVFKAPGWLFGGLIGGVALLAGHEYLGLAAGHGIAPFRKTTLLFIGLYFAGLALFAGQFSWRWIPNPDVFAFALVTRVFPLLLLVIAMAREDLRSSLPAAAYSYLAVPYLAFTLGMLVTLQNWKLLGAQLLLFFLIIIWVGDTAAYYFGRAFGKHRMAPRISPGKSWEGAAASFVASAAVGGLLFHYAAAIHGFLVGIHLLQAASVFGDVTAPHAPTLWLAVAFSICLNVAAQLGDLVESMMKRGAGVKDSGHLLPGHGGMLDRIDALLLAAPVLWYYAPYLARGMFSPSAP